MGKLKEILDINESLLDGIDESIPFRWSGDGNWTDKWVETIQKQYKDLVGTFKREVSVKVAGRPAWALTFSEMTFIGLSNSRKGGEIVYVVPEGEVKKGDSFSEDSDGNLIAGSVRALTLPANVKSMKQVKKFLEDHALSSEESSDGGLEEVTRYLKSHPEVNGVKKLLQVTKNFNNKWLEKEKFILALTGVGLFLFHCSSLNNPQSSYRMSNFIQGVETIDQNKLNIDGMYGKRTYAGEEMKEVHVHVSNQGKVQWNMIIDTDDEVTLKKSFVKSSSSDSTLYIRMPKMGDPMMIQIFKGNKFDYEDRNADMKKALNFVKSGTFRELKFN